jgi:hypothetical protein
VFKNKFVQEKQNRPLIAEKAVFLFHYNQTGLETLSSKSTNN